MSDPASAGRSPLGGMNDGDTNEDEVLTSDAEELAEVMANRSLEKYMDRVDGKPETEKQTHLGSGKNHSTALSVVDLPDNPQTPMKHTQFRTRPLSRSSSPTLMTQTSEHDDVSQVSLQPSSPDAAVPRYSPPERLPVWQDDSVDGHRPLHTEDIPATREIESLSSQASRIVLDVFTENKNMETSRDGSAMSLTDSPRVEPRTPPRGAFGALWSSPLSSPILDLPHEAASVSPPRAPLVMTQQPPQALNPPLSLSSPVVTPASHTVNTSRPSSPSLSLPRHSLHDPVSPPREIISNAPQGRALRTRTARQQHPYAFEYAHYKNSMRRAGLDDAIVKLQAIEREKALKERGHQKQVESEMEGFILPEDEESQDLYVPPATPQVQRSRTVEPMTRSIDMESLLANFGGMISDDESPARRRERKEKGKGKDSATSKKVRAGPKPFPISTTERASYHAPSPTSPPTEWGPSSSALRQLPPSSPASSLGSTGQVKETLPPPGRLGQDAEAEQPSQSSSRASDSESESDESSSGSLAAAERKRLRILHRMMPAAWVRRQMGEETRKQQAKASSRTRRDSLLPPGQARARTRMRNPNEPLVLVGDSESDNDGPPAPSQDAESPRPITPSSRTQKRTRPRVFPPRQPTQVSDDSGNDIVDILSSDDHSSVVEITMPIVDDEEISSWLARKSPKRARSGGEGGGGGDLINRMLSRTSGPARGPRQRHSKGRTGYDRDGRKLKQAKLTSMFRASSPSNRILELSSSDEAETGAGGSHVSRNAKKRRHSGTRAARISGAGTTHYSGSRRTFTIHGDLAELLDATILPDVERKAGKIKILAHNRAISADVHIRERCEHSQGQPQVQSPTRRPKKPDAFSHRSVSADSGIIPFRPHTKFSPSTYIGRGYLQNLISVAIAAETPRLEATPLIVFGEHLDTRLTGTEFVDQVYESERRWELIFCFSALEAFSSQTGRLLSTHPPISRWPWVCKTIKDIRLKEDKIVAEDRQRRQRVDYYVRIVTARCWLLHTMWGWNYSQPDRLLNLLYPVFQTRKLAKLRDERTDFPTFIRNLDLEHLERFSNGDTAWSMFLKIFRKTIVDSPASARKLYSAYSPVAVLNFTNENPATDMDLSRLFNSFAMFLVILITDPTSERGADCVKRMQGLVSFKTADMRSREACIRAFQYAGLLFKYYQLELAPLVSWMHLMLQSLQDDMRGDILLPQRNRLVVLVLCLVRSVAAVASTCGFDRDSKKTHPETALLTQDFIQTIFQLDLKNNTAARREIKQFLEAFCHARDAFLATLPSKPVEEIVVDEESQENYGYDEFDLDLNDPEVLAGLDAYEDAPPAQSVDVDPLILRERHTAQLFNNTVSPAVFENIVLGFGLDNRRLSNTPEQGYDAPEESAWIRVWFGCAKIVVGNRQRSWWDYLDDWGGAKDERISRIIDVSAERRVRIYFCYLVLKDTPALVQRGSKERKHQFLLPWFQCLPHHRYTVEHKYTALICDLGLKSDPLLEGLPCRTNEKGEYCVLSSELMAERGNYVRCVLTNLSRMSRTTHEGPSAAILTRARTCVAKLFETMKQTWDHLNRQYATSADKELIPSYLDFCRYVRSSAAELLVTPPIQDLSSRLSWVPLTP
ncbi:hypothetical protein FS749_003422 [Ceratobasidium sp. UAMH 11750]|nr:hypothetical protein FS749_003422 [Ceratobasidium sp. UAMH 11750]